MQKIFAYIHIEKCGGTTLINMLRNGLGTRHFDVMPEDKESMVFSKGDFEKVLALQPEVRSISGHCIRIHPLETYADRLLFYTILREPIKRYISDFKHFNRCFDCSDSFANWLQVAERRNFMTRAIAGEENLSKAINLIDERVGLVGVIEEYEDFIIQLRCELFPDLLQEHLEIKNVAANRLAGFYKLYEWLFWREKLGKNDEAYYNDLDFEKLNPQIAEANSLDIELYRYVCNEVLPRQKIHYAKAVARVGGQWIGSPFRLKYNRTKNLLYRNMIYKPYLGYFPFRPQILPVYRSIYK